MKKQITMSTLGKNGRLGNQLFQYASMIGLSVKYNSDLVLPPWDCSKYFDHPFPNGATNISGQVVIENQFTYIDNWPALDQFACVDLKGYLQSEKYWVHCKDYVRTALTFKKEFIDQCRARFDWNDLYNAIAIHIRRGDYVNNPNYVHLPLTAYYLCALIENFPDWRDRNIVVFSDDIQYCRTHFITLPNVHFCENNTPIEDLCLMSQCRDFILSNSTFAWWGAYLAKDRNKVIRPSHYFAGHLAKSTDPKDLYPPEWTVFDHSDRKIDLRDVTFMIPVGYDHPDRKQNFDLCVRMLQRNFDTDIIVCELVNPSVGQKFSDCVNTHRVRYTPWVYNKFHRTRMLNSMSRYTDRPYIFNWDADVMVPPLQILEAVDLLRNGADMVYPYRWAFARVPRSPWYEKLKVTEDIGIVGDTRFNGMNPNDAHSHGGAVGYRRESFFKAGMENENFISYGPEDTERYSRFIKLGFKVDRVKGPNLYHLNHYVGPNSCPRHADFRKNEEEYNKVRRMTPNQLAEYISTWHWL